MEVPPDVIVAGVKEDEHDGVPKAADPVRFTVVLVPGLPPVLDVTTKDAGEEPAAIGAKPTVIVHVELGTRERPFVHVVDVIL